ncbi:MAG: gamma-glutamyltransferase [Pirellulales bacterium]|nr:gamma-glutamyltransferase [Pirellulales bacterium]
MSPDQRPPDVGLPVAANAASHRLAERSFPRRSPAVAKHGMAATSQPQATLVALETLKAGGNAVDAAIAANAMLCLTEPSSCGIGGDLFAIVWDAKTQQLYGLNASGRSPKSLALEEFSRQGLKYIPNLGPLAVTVPGCIDGWFELHARFGTLGFEQILEPAIHYGQQGFPVTEVIASAWAGGAEELSKYAGFRETFLPNGTPPRHGELFRNPALASTLQQIAKGGADVFYRGPVARKIDEFMPQVGGFLQYEDLASHRSEWVKPCGVEYRGSTVWELPPNGQGIAVLQMLQMLKRFDLRSAGFGSADHIHLLVEAKKLAFEDRARFYADPDFYDAPIDELLSDEYADQRCGLIQPSVAGKSVDAGNPALGRGDTVYLTTADKDRNFVSLIQSNYWGFGSGLCPPGLGFCLQNRGELFDLSPHQANTYAPGKRPFHTIIPAFVTRGGQPLLSFGLMGGDMQPQGHVQILLNLFEFQMGLQEAGDAPRVRHAGSSTPTGKIADSAGGEVLLEPGISPEVARELQGRGHSITSGYDSFGGYQAIWYDRANDVYYGATESRKDGVALGY